MFNSSVVVLPNISTSSLYVYVRVRVCVYREYGSVCPRVRARCITRHCYLFFLSLFSATYSYPPADWPMPTVWMLRPANTLSVGTSLASYVASIVAIQIQYKYLYTMHMYGTASTCQPHACTCTCRHALYMHLYNIYMLRCKAWLKQWAYLY